MTIEEMLERMDSSEMTDWAAIFAIEDEDNEKANSGKSGKLSEQDNEDFTDALIAAIDQDRLEEG